MEVVDVAAHHLIALNFVCALFNLLSVRLIIASPSSWVLGIKGIWAWKLIRIDFKGNCLLPLGDGNRKSKIGSFATSEIDHKVREVTQFCHKFLLFTNCFQVNISLSSLVWRLCADELFIELIASIATAAMLYKVLVEATSFCLAQLILFSDSRCCLVIRTSDSRSHCFWDHLFSFLLLHKGFDVDYIFQVLKAWHWVVRCVLLRLISVLDKILAPSCSSYLHIFSNRLLNYSSGFFQVVSGFSVL